MTLVSEGISFPVVSLKIGCSHAANSRARANNMNFFIIFYSLLMVMVTTGRRTVEALTVEGLEVKAASVGLKAR